MKYAIQAAFDVEPPCKVKDILRDLTPIELPTDEEIEEMIANYGVTNTSQIEATRFTAKWMRDKINTAHEKEQENDAR